MLKAERLTQHSPTFTQSQICPYCQDPFSLGELVVACPVDKTLLHADCWEANDSQCTTLGCQGAGIIEYSQAIRPPVFSLPPSRPRTAVRPPRRPSTHSSSYSRSTSRQPARTQQRRSSPMLSRHVLALEKARRQSWFLTIAIAYFLFAEQLTDWFGTAVLPPLAVAVALIAMITTSYLTDGLGGWQLEAARWGRSFALSWLSLEFLLVVVSVFAISSLSFPFVATLVVGTATHIGAWNHVGQMRYRFWQRVSAFALSYYFADWLLRFADVSLRLDPPPIFFMIAVAGATIGAILSGYLGLWDGDTRRGVAQFLPSGLTAVHIALLTLIIGQIVKEYLFPDIFTSTNVAQSAIIEAIYHIYTVSSVAIGSAIGSSEQSQARLATLYRYLLKLIWTIIRIAIVAFGGYISYQIGLAVGLNAAVYLLSLALLGAYVTFLILRSWFGFF